MDEIKSKILNRLSEIELEKQVKIPIAIESGSRAWGFASPDSDYDCRYIYVHKKERYLSIFEQKDVMEDVPDPIYDVNGWDLKKVLLHLVKSNAVMFEWLNSPITYRTNQEIRQLLLEVGEQYFNPVSVSWQYLSMAKSKWEQLRGGQPAAVKTYCYILRPLAAQAYIRIYNAIPHMEYQENLNQISLPDQIHEEIRQLLLYKSKVEEKGVFQPRQCLLDYLQRELELAENWVKRIRYDRKQNYEKADEAFRFILGKLWENEAD